MDEALSLLTDANIAGIEQMFANNIPHSLGADTHKTQVLITDNGNTLDAFGDNDFHSVTDEVEVQIWYSDNQELDYSAIELGILKAFTKANWQVSGWKRRILDPDTKQLSNTTYITHTRNV